MWEVTPDKIVTGSRVVIYVHGCLVCLGQLPGELVPNNLFSHPFEY